jgi:hypothetical protein
MDDSTQRLMALAAWRFARRCYRFDPALQRAVLETPYDGWLTSALLSGLDGGAAYVETPDLVLHGQPVHGFFCCLSHEPGQGVDWLVVALDRGDANTLLPMTFVMDGATIEDAVQDLAIEVEVHAHLEGSPPLRDAAQIAGEIREVYVPVLTLIAYLCTSGVELSSADRLTDGCWPLEVGAAIGGKLRQQAHRIDIETSRAWLNESSTSRIERTGARWELVRTGRGVSLRWHPPSVSLANAAG